MAIVIMKRIMGVRGRGPLLIHGFSFAYPNGFLPYPLLILWFFRGARSARKPSYSIDGLVLSDLAGDAAFDTSSQIFYPAPSDQSFQAADLLTGIQGSVHTVRHKPGKLRVEEWKAPPHHVTPPHPTPQLPLQATAQPCPELSWLHFIVAYAG